jgi:hypothetical protein
MAGKDGEDLRAAEIGLSWIFLRVLETNGV